MPKRPTLQDVAEATGLSAAAVSYALRDQRGSAQTRRRVREAAAELGYAADPIARALASGRTGTIAVLCGSARDPWQQQLVGDLTRALHARGLRALVADADGDEAAERELLELLLAQRPDGMVVAPLEPGAEQWRAVAEQTPLVAIGDQLAQAPESGAVVFDNATGVALVLDHLHALGHRRLGVVVPARPSTPDRPGERAVTARARRLGLEITLIPTPPPTARPDDMAAHLSATLADAARPTAVFGFSDAFAFAALRAARQLGLAVPDDLSVVGFEDVEIADLAGPGLTSVDWGGDAASSHAVDLLHALIDGTSTTRVRTVSPELVVRGTTAAPH